MTAIEVVNGTPDSGDLVEFRTAGGPRPAGIPEAEFSGAKGTTLLLHRDGGRTLFAGLGDVAQADGETLRRAAGQAVRHLVRLGSEHVTLMAGEWSHHARALVEGAILAAYQFDEFRPADARRKNSLRTVRVAIDSPEALVSVRTEAENGALLAEVTNEARALGNQPPNRLTPEALAGRAQKLAGAHRLTCKIWDARKLDREGFHGIVSVGKGSAAEPRLIALEYMRGSRREKPVLLVGKAVTFDSGGLCIKGREGMEEMKWDKMGGVAVLGAMQAIASLKLPVSVIGLIPAAENMLGEKAWRPSDIIEIYGGKTVEILNTDAEGRIILADALSYGRQHYQPRAIIDIATLTGACVVALGQSRAGLFTDDEHLAGVLAKAAARSGDALWRLPIGEDYDELIKSDVAAVKNIGPRWGGASTAACFLRRFTEDVPWAHLDIAGVAWLTKEKPWMEAGATGFGVRLLVEAVRGLSSVPA